MFQRRIELCRMLHIGLFCGYQELLDLQNVFVQLVTAFLNIVSADFKVLQLTMFCCWM